MYTNNYDDMAEAYDDYGCYGHDGHVTSATDMTPFFRQLSPGTRVTAQYDCQCPSCGTFQGFQDSFILLDNFNGFPGLTRLSPREINAISPFDGGHHGY